MDSINPLPPEQDMTFISALGLVAAMAVLAAAPSISVFAVTSRAAISGFSHGMFVALGVVAGDMIFILLAILGLVLLVDVMGELFILAKLLGGAYLIWLGTGFWRTRNKTSQFNKAGSGSLFSSFMTGLLITLADQKAVLFYLGFLPVFLDLKRLSYFDTGLVMLIALVAVGGVKLGYVCIAADVGKHIAGGRYSTIVNLLVAAVMIAAGIWLVISTGLEFTAWLR
ncbi:MAG: LysE family translocator [Gammaproteobacteria bacterium]